MTKEDYNNLPVFYCRTCGSLKIMRLGESIQGDYCDDCGSTDIGKTSIRVWQDLQKTKYKPLYLNKPIIKY